MAKRKRIGLALGGGGARGLAHIGLLKVFEEEDIPIDYICGTSMGGLVGGLYAVGHSAVELEELAYETGRARNMVRMIDLSFPRGHALRGVLEGDGVRRFLSGIVGRETVFSDLQIPLAVTAVDIIRGLEVVLDKGSVLESLMATIAIPGVFKPVIIDGQSLVDGGVLNNVPADVGWKMGAEMVIAVDVGVDIFDPASWGTTALPGIAREIDRMLEIRTHYLVQAKLQKAKPDIVISPSIPSMYNTFYGFHKSGEIIAAGEQAARAHVDEIRQKIDPDFSLRIRRFLSP